MVATAIYSVTFVLWKETAFPLCRATKGVGKGMLSDTAALVLLLLFPIKHITTDK